MLRAHAQTAGISLTAQQPYNNLVRVTLQALAAVLGGTQSLHTNSFDETYALPTEEAATLALRTQQIIAHESGVDRAVDPLGGSWLVEQLTDEVERRANELLRRIDEIGGMIRAIEEGFPQREIAESAYRIQQEIERGERPVVGLNCYGAEEAIEIPFLRVDESVARGQLERLRAVKCARSLAKVDEALRAVESAARGQENLVPPVLAAVKAYATLGEISDVLRRVWGAHRETSSF
jgi:methylmalonyl-CoA mutase N-terminal domain/subunit